MSMIWHEEYRGYHVSYQSGDHTAWIKPSSSEIPLLERAIADAGEGRMELRFKAHSIIDQEIATRSGQLSSAIALPESGP